MNEAPTSGGEANGGAADTGTQTQNRYTFWCYRAAAGKAKVDYNELTKPIESFGTVERFWQVYDHIVRPNDFKTSADYH